MLPFYRSCLLLLFLITPLLSQTERAPDWAETGLPYIRNYPAKEYQGNPQNWAVAQDSSGLIYVGNGHGVLIYDGVSWELIPVANRTTVRSLTVHNDTVFVGAQNEFGYLWPDRIGRQQYHSLISYLPPDQLEFADVWQTLALTDAVYFRTSKYLFRWQYDSLYTFLPGQGFHTGFVCNDALYVRSWGVGLMQMQNDSLVLLPGGDAFANERIYMMVPFGATSLLIGSSTAGLFVFDGQGFTPFPTAVDDYLRDNSIYHGAALEPDLIAIGTLHGGLVIINHEGQLCQIIDSESGLINSGAKYVLPDRDGGLWLALNNGVARVETPSPLSKFDKRIGVSAITETAIRFQDKLYLGTHNGVLRLVPGTAEQAHFEQVPGISIKTWDLLPFDNALIAATNKGLFELKGDRAEPVLRVHGAPTTLHRSRKDSTLLFSADANGLMVVKIANRAWSEPHYIKGVSGNINSIVEPEPDVLWVSTLYNGVYRVTLTGGEMIPAEIAHFDTSNGLPLQRIKAVLLNNQLLFLTNKGLRRFAPEHQRFVLDSTFGAVLADTSCWLFNAREDTDNRTWFVGYNRDRELKLYGYFERGADSTMQWKGKPFERFNDLGLFYDFYPDPAGGAWLAGSEGVGRYNPEFPFAPEKTFSTRVRRITSISDDSVFYGGAGSTFSAAEIAFPHNSLRFTFAASYFQASEAMQYQVKLEGYDKNWSHWTLETRKDYTGLPAGTYTFRVRAKNIYGQIGKEGRYEFRILPPWFQTWWAYLLYAGLGFLLIVAIVKWRVRQLKIKTRRLEQTISDRTREITAQKDKIAQQAEALKDLNHAKSRFFANISHEFRTPLTLILGPLEDQLAKSTSADEKYVFGLMHRNASRLLQLINQLLDISQLESGKLQLEVSPGNLPEFLQTVISTLSSLAEQKHITLQLDLNIEASVDSEWYFDRDKLEKILINLIANAIKFTPEYGDVRLTADMHETNVRIRVRDTGIGIPEWMQIQIFDRFERVQKARDNKFQGSGIGLALTKELVELHHGQISVRSEEGSGSEFTVILPMRKQDYSHDELILQSSHVARQMAPMIDFPEKDAAPQPAPDRHADETLVLIIEDHSDVRAYIRQQIDERYTILEAADGETGVQLAREMVPDLIISDVMMGEMDGYQVCEILKTDEKTSHIPIILLTAKAGEESKLAGLATGADDYLTKPFNAKELLARMKNLITLRRTLRERFRKEGLLEPRTRAMDSVDEKFLQKLMQVIEENLETYDFNVEKLAQSMNMTARQLHRKVSALSGRSPVELIRYTRLTRAKHLIEQNAGNISEIAYQVGFNNLSYFARAFKDAFGKAPSEWEK